MEELVFHQPHQGVHSYDLVTVQENVKRVLDEITDKPHMDSSLLESVVLTTGTTTLVEHKLGRNIRGWYIADRNAGATVYRDTASTADLAEFLPLITSATVTVSLVVF